MPFDKMQSIFLNALKSEVKMGLMWFCQVDLLDVDIIIYSLKKVEDSIMNFGKFCVDVRDLLLLVL